MNKKLVLLSAFLITLFVSSCKKPEGEGGSGRIKGALLAQQWNSTFTIKQAEYPGMDEWVYLIYGDDISYGDRIRTNYNGEFEFKYLREGSYKVYVYSEDSTLQSPSGQIAIVKSVTVKNDQTTDLGTITICK